MFNFGTLIDACVRLGELPIARIYLGDLQIAACGQCVPTASSIPTGTDDVAYLVAGGGGGGGLYAGGGGGAGGLLMGKFTPTPGETQAIVIGAGGIEGSNIPSRGVQSGNASSLGSLVALGGGRGGTNWNASEWADDGGSGGGGEGQRNSPGGMGTPGQGHKGGAGFTELVVCGQSYRSFSGGGGGAGSPGLDGILNVKGGDGGQGLKWGCDYYCGGGGAGGYGASSDVYGECVYPGGYGGKGGGGDGAWCAQCRPVAGGINTGGGAGGGAVFSQIPSSWGRPGGSGVVVLRTRRTAASTTGSPTVTQDVRTVNNAPDVINVYTFTGSGSITF